MLFPLHLLYEAALRLARLLGAAHAPNSFVAIDLVRRNSGTQVATNFNIHFGPCPPYRQRRGPSATVRLERVCAQRLHRLRGRLSKHTVRLYWKRSDGTPYAYLSKASRYPH
jgi:hypothetical protein